jgi:hypothetical protein
MIIGVLVIKIISHRGNLNGPDASTENNPAYINKIIDLGYDIEIDLWYVNGDLYLGHDEPYYKIDKYWLINRKDKLWVHIKNLDAIQFAKNHYLNYFWHENDKMTLTSNGTPWCYPGIYIPSGVTVVLTDEIIDVYVYGVCTDYPELYRK